MASTGVGTPGAALSGGIAAVRARAWRVDDFARAAWLCALPCAAVIAAIAYLLGPPLAGLAPSGEGYTFLEGVVFRPEPTEVARYGILAFAPLLLALATAFAPRWLARVPASASHLGVVVSQVALVAVVAV